MQGMYGFALPDSARGYRDIYSFRTPYIASRDGDQEHWMIAGQVAAGGTTRVMSANDFIAVPFIVARDSVVDKMSIRVTTAANFTTSNGCWGIYDSENDFDELYPSRLLGWGSASIKSTGIKSVECSIPLEGGRVYWAWYWGQFGGLGSVWGTLRAMTLTCGASHGHNTSMGPLLSNGMHMSLAFDSVRSVAPPGLSWVDVTVANTRPMIAMRFSA